MPPADADRVSTEIEDGGGDPIYTIDDFLRDCAVTLGVPQKVVEDEYYILDLPDILAKTREYRAAEELRRMQMLLAASGRQLPEGRNTNDILLRCKRRPASMKLTKNNDLAAKRWMNYEPLPTNTCGGLFFERS
ncbi:hypothetical protein P7H22_10680 [Paenibacillus larvae]|nr:hypothetical protein [Paenibacillus larvae]MDT2240708.1 hypothetical protein [Paenibacillus larvae]